MIKVEHLSKSFNKTKAVDNISFEVAEGENLVLLGTSGCGKTTTLKMINRLIEPDQGKVFIHGQNIMDQQPETLRRGIGYVLQNNGLFPHYTVAENIAVVPQLLKWNKKQTQHRVSELLEKLHLDKKYLSVYPNELSGGQQQRVGLARALVTDPAVLLMDEPFGALDTVTRSKIQAEFKALDELKRKTIIMVTHDVQEAFELGDRICLMDKGKIVQNGLPGDLLFKPVNAFVRDFLKDQRLQLEFKAIKLRDIIDLRPKGGVFELHGEVLSQNISLWHVLEGFKFSKAENLHIIDHYSKKKTVLGFEGLMTAFYQYKKRQAHE
ncbi:ABC transporter ATP-binding protein [Mucilaginibacter panaciglaebae]|uniref:ABC transporter ATP-binding protein n=1 Tax=Mucilaginibacter panaciglaebae TaxID=502331 RepID=A0ABP7X5Y8_9SPHI